MIIKVIKRILCLFFLVIIISTVSSCSKENGTEIIETYEIQTGMTYEEKVDELLSQFDTYTSYTNGNFMFFDGEIETSYKESQIDFLSNIDAPLTKKYSASLNAETGVINMDVSYIDSDITIKTESYEAMPYFDELSDDYLFEFEGEVFSVANMIYEGTVNECIAGVDDIAVIGGCAILIGGLFLISAISQDPTYQKTMTTAVQQVTETVSVVVKSIIGWFRSILKTIVKTITKTIVKTIEVVKTIYKITVSGITFEFVEADSSKYKDDGSYYLALADTSYGGGGKVYFSTLKIDRNFAIAVLRSSQFVALVNSLGNKAKVLLSTYTFNAYDAMSIAEEASLNGGVTYHPAHAKSWMPGVYFAHYHPTSPYLTSAHSFFGYPTIIS